MFVSWSAVASSRLGFGRNIDVCGQHTVEVGAEIMRLGRTEDPRAVHYHVSKGILDIVIAFAPEAADPVAFRIENGEVVTFVFSQANIDQMDCAGLGVGASHVEDIPIGVFQFPCRFGGEVVGFQSEDISYAIADGIEGAGEFVVDRDFIRLAVGIGGSCADLVLAADHSGQHHR